jgi:hypothetical protein
MSESSCREPLPDPVAFFVGLRCEGRSSGKPIRLEDATSGLRYGTHGSGPGGILDTDGDIIAFWYQ